MLEIRLDGRLSTPEDFQNIVLREIDDYPVRLGDVALVEHGVEDDSLIVRANGQPAVGLSVLRQSQANTMEMHWSLSRIWDDIDADREVDVVIFTGAGDKAFSAGGDAKKMRDQAGDCLLYTSPSPRD